MAATISTTPKVAYIFDASANDGSGAWHPVAGAASPDVSYAWTQSHSFAAAVSMSNTLRALRGINNFATVQERATAIPAPIHGTISYIQSTSTLEFWNGFSWTQLGTTDTTGGAIVRRNSEGAINGNITGSASSASTATTAASLTTPASPNFRQINGKSYTAALNQNFILTPTTVLNPGATTVSRYSRIFVRNTQTTPATNASIDNDSLRPGDIYIGW